METNITIQSRPDPITKLIVFDLYVNGQLTFEGESREGAEFVFQGLMINEIDKHTKEYYAR